MSGQPEVAAPAGDTHTVGEAPAAHLHEVTRRWGPKTVLDGANLVLPAGTRGFLGGRNGAGKTTLLRIAAGLLEPDAGTVELYGLHPTRDRRRYQQRLGYLPAGNGGLYARLTARQNLEFWASLGLLSKPDRSEAVDAALQRFDLAALERSRVDRISMGQRQRVRLAMTFLHSPSLVLLDEPHTSLDDEALDVLRGALDEHHAAGGTSLWCAPSSKQASLDSDAAFIVEDGQVKQA